MRTLIVVVAFLIPPGRSLMAQEVLPQLLELTLEEALEKVRADNYDMKKALAELSIAKSRLNGANAVFLPVVDVSENFVRTNDPLNVFGFKLKQGITTSGDFNPELLNDPETIENFNTRLDVEQPLLNLDGMAARSATKDYYQASEYAYARTLHHVEFLTRKEYFNLWLAYHIIEAVEKSVEAAEEAHKTAKDNLEAGYILESDLLAAELHLLDLQTRLDQAEAAYEYTNDYLKYLLQIEGEVVIRPTDEMMVSQVETGNLEQVPDTRSDFLALMSRRMGAEKMLRASRFQYVPNLNARFAYEWNDATVFGTAADNYLLGVSLRWRLFDGARRLSTIQQRKAELDKVQIEYNEQKETANLELRKARRQMEIASTRLKTTDIALKRAEDLYRIKRNRFGEGMEKVEDLLNAESVLFSKRIERLQAMYQHQITVYTLEFLLEQNING